MLMAIPLLTILTRFPYIISTIHTCVPNSKFVFNGRICYCDSIGRWSEANCKLPVVERRHDCQPGQVIWQGCKQCVCQENGQLSCEEGSCSGGFNDRDVLKNLSALVPWCTPFRSYYMDCSICVCPASGRMSDARCVADSSCSSKIKSIPSNFDWKKKNTCIPKVMYIFPCVHCLCSDGGLFVLNKCVETCQKKHKTEPRRIRCTPKTLYRKDCNVCQCPTSGILDDKLCTRTVCNTENNIRMLRSLKEKTRKCVPHRFSKPKCLYCECSPEGKVNEDVCLELDCLKASENINKEVGVKCSAGEMIPFCIECFCPRNGLTNDKYCTKTCSHKSKINILEKIANDSGRYDRLVNRDAIKQNVEVENMCEPNTVYIYQSKMCLCADNGVTSIDLCIFVEDIAKNKPRGGGNNIDIDFNVRCEPSTFIDFDCNTCFCSKNGTIDPKWCTYDDCESKRTILKTLEAREIPEGELSNECKPGSISKVKCNFCICPESGILDKIVCTSNDCSSFIQPSTQDNFMCEPLAYYEVDCNICFCPRNGVKNIAKCTKNHCEKSFLRSDVCLPGQLFSDECNVCICPPNGNKAEKACTNYTCSDTASWKKIFQLSESLLGNTITIDETRSLDMCFPGEEFVVDCKICVCSDMGLKVYASCSSSLCDEERTTQRTDQKYTADAYKMVAPIHRSRREEDCMTFNLTNSAERQECTPGTMYIIRCRQCICPYMGNINNFCRPLPKDFYCEQAYPYFNYKPMGRRNTAGNLTTGNSTFSQLPQKIQHEHTKYHCEKPGKLMDACFICECEESTNVLVEEHCFKSDEVHCVNATPTFLKDYEKIVNR